MTQDVGTPPPPSSSAPDPASAGDSQSGLQGQTDNGAPPPPSASDGSSPPSGSEGAYRPQGVPEHLLGANDRETIDKLAKSYTGARQAISERGEVPEDPSGYKLEGKGRLAAYGDLNANPFFEGVRQEAHKHGLSDKQFNGFMNGFLEKMIDGGILHTKEQLDQQRAALIPEAVRHLSPPEQETAIAQRQSDNKALLEGWKAQGMSDAARAILTSSLEAAGGNEAVEWMYERLRGVQPVTGGGGSMPVTREDLQSRLRDPKSNPSSGQYDKHFVAQTSKLYQQLFPS